MLDRPSFTPSNARVLPSCPIHLGSLIRRYRVEGPHGPAVYPQCLPGGSDQAHLLAWPVESIPTADAGRWRELSPSELDVLRDAAAGLTTGECALKRMKGAQTVKTQRKSVLAKLEARNITQAVGIALSRQIITSERAE
jgi:DNA-binding NarL/FixJ family response regulator